MERYNVNAAEFVVRRVGTVQFSDTAFTNCHLPSLLNGLKTSESLLALNRDGLIVNVAARDGEQRGLYVSQTNAVIDLLIRNKKEHDESGESGAVADAVAEEQVFHFISLSSSVDQPVTNLSFNADQSILAVLAVNRILFYQTQQLIAACQSSDSAQSIKPFKTCDVIDQSSVVHSEWSKSGNKLFLLTAKGTVCCCDALNGSIDQLTLDQPSSSISSFTLLPSNYSPSNDVKTPCIVVGTKSGELHVCTIVDANIRSINRIDAHKPDEPSFNEQPRVHSLSSIASSLIVVGFQAGSDASVDPDLTAVSLLDIDSREWRDCGDLLDEETRFVQIRDGLTDEDRLQSDAIAPYSARHHYQTLSLLDQPWQMSLILSNRSENINIIGPPITLDTVDSNHSDLISWQRWDLDDPLLVPTDSNFEDAYALGAAFDLTNKALPIPNIKSPMPIFFMLTSDGRLHAHSFILGNDDDSKAKASAAIMNPSFNSHQIEASQSINQSNNQPVDQTIKQSPPRAELSTSVESSQNATSTSVSAVPPILSPTAFALPSPAVAAQSQKPVSVKPMFPQAPAAVTPTPFSFSAPPSTNAQPVSFGNFSFPAASDVKPAAPAPFSFSAVSSTSKSTSDPNSIPASKPFSFAAPASTSTQPAFSFASASTSSAQPPVNRSLFDSTPSTRPADGSTISSALPMSFTSASTITTSSSNIPQPSKASPSFATPAATPKQPQPVNEAPIQRTTSFTSPPTPSAQSSQSFKPQPSATSSSDPFDRANYRVPTSTPAVPAISQSTTAPVNVRSTLQPSDFNPQTNKPNEAIIHDALQHLAERMKDLNSIQQESKEMLRRLATPVLRSGNHSNDESDEFNVHKLYAIKSSVRDLNQAIQPMLDTESRLPEEIDKINSSIVQIREQLEQAQQLRDSLDDPAVAQMVAAMPLDADASAKLASINRKSLWLTQKLDELDMYLADRWALVRSELGLGGGPQMKMRTLQDVQSLIESHQRLIQTQQREVERLERQMETLERSSSHSNSLSVSDVPTGLTYAKDDQRSHLLFNNDNMVGRRQLTVSQASPDRARVRSSAVNTPIVSSHLNRTNRTSTVTPPSKMQPLIFPRPPSTPVSVALSSDDIHRLTASFNEKVALSTGKKLLANHAFSNGQANHSTQSKDLVNSLLNQADAPHFQQQAYLRPLPSTELLNSAAKNQTTPGSSRRWARSKQTTQVPTSSATTTAQTSSAINDERLGSVAESVDQEAVQRIYDQRVEGTIGVPQPFMSFTLPKPTSSASSVPATTEIKPVPSPVASSTTTASRSLFGDSATSSQKSANPFAVAASSQSFTSPVFGQSNSSSLSSVSQATSSSSATPAFSFSSIGAPAAQAKPAFSFSSAFTPAADKSPAPVEPLKQSMFGQTNTKPAVPSFTLPPASPLSPVPGAAVQTETSTEEAKAITSPVPSSAVITPNESTTTAEPGAKVQTPPGTPSVVPAKIEKIAAPVIAPVTSKTGFGFSGVIPTFSFGSGASTSTTPVLSFGAPTSSVYIPSFGSATSSASLPSFGATSATSTSNGESAVAPSTTAVTAATDSATASSLTSPLPATSPSLAVSSATSLLSTTSTSLPADTAASLTSVSTASTATNAASASQSAAAPAPLFSFSSQSTSSAMPSFGSSSSSLLSAATTSSTVANPFASLSSTGSTPSSTSFGFGSQSSSASSMFPTTTPSSSSATSTTAASASGFGFGSLGSALSTPAKETNTGFGMGGLSFGTPAPAAASGGQSLGMGVFGQNSTTGGFGSFSQSSMSTDPFALLNKAPSFGSGFNAPSPHASSSMASESEPSPMSAFGSSFSNPLSVTQVSQPMANPFAVSTATPSPFGVSSQPANPFQTTPSANSFAAPAAPVAANPFGVSNPAFGGGGFGSSFSNSAFGGGNSFGSSMSAAAPAPAFGQSLGASAGFGAPASGGFAAPATTGFGAAPAASGFGTAATTTSGFGAAPPTSGFGALGQGGFGGFAQAASAAAPAQSSGGWGSRPFGQTSNVNFNTGAFRG